METPVPNVRPTGAPRAMLLAGGLVAVLVVLAVAALAIRGPGSSTYAEGSPEAAFQSYLAAYDAEDLETAYGLFSSSVRDAVSFAEYRSQVSQNGWMNEQERRVVLDGVKRAGTVATLRLRVDQFSGGGFGGSTYSSERSVRLIQEDGEWRIDELLVGVDQGYIGF